MLATVRNRRGVLASVEAADGPAGRIHLVQVEYKDDQLPAEERLVWELEPRTRLLEPTQLPEFARADPMRADDFDAIVRAARWTALAPFLGPDGPGKSAERPITSPFRGAVQIEDYQLVPLLKALQMPRVSLLLADDVGLGKTIEAGLIISELLVRRRIQRILVLTPASLRLQWQRDELWEKFSLHFDVVDRNETHRLKRELGIDANPWRSFSRIVASYHYLRQPDVLEQFLATCRHDPGSAHLPWDLLIVDECHNLMPAPFGEDSELCRMLRVIAPHFEHRIFLSATPHNGHTRSFTGLLEILDPVRFSQTDELKPAERGRVEQVVIRRLKREINARSNPPKFCSRETPVAIPLRLGPKELALVESFDRFRAAVRRAIAARDRRERRAGSFAIEILGKRLLSCPTALAESWSRCRRGMADEAGASAQDVGAAERSVREETANDSEANAREVTAAVVVGAWLRDLKAAALDEIDALDRALKALGLGADKGVVELDPSEDARCAALFGMIERLLRQGGEWRDDERLVVFTEYKTTLDYLARRLRTRYGEEDRILTLYGGQDDDQRDRVKLAFNDPTTKVRILLATDAAAEGLNLQRTARYLLHFDCPWNPSRIEQRNGRLDRHGQPRDVTVHHFVTDQDADLKFLAHVIGKVDQIREDLGSVGDILDEAVHRRLVDGEPLDGIRRELDRRLELARNRAAFAADAASTVTMDRDGRAEAVQSIADALDLDARSLRDTLEAALAVHAGRPQLECDDQAETCRLVNPALPGWTETIDESLRRQTAGGTRGPVPRIAFSAKPLMEQVGPRLVFAPRRDTALVHLAHPLIQRALATLGRRRYPGQESVSRWTVRGGDVPSGADALILFTLEELAVNELRESFHHWIRTVALPVTRGKLGAPLAERPAISWRDAIPVRGEAAIKRAREILEDVESELRAQVVGHAARLSEDLAKQLDYDHERARKDEEARYRSRQGEISALIQESTLQKLEKELGRLKIERGQGVLAFAADRLDDLERSIEAKEDELKRRRRQYEEVRDQLERERERVLKNLLPRRYRMAGPARVFPVVIEVRLPRERDR